MKSDTARGMHPVFILRVTSGFLNRLKLVFMLIGSVLLIAGFGE